MTETEKTPELAGLSNSSVPGETPAPPETAAPANRQRTRLHEILNEQWGIGWPSDYAYGHLIQYANPEMAEKTKNGFSLKSSTGTLIHWEAASQRSSEFIGCQKGADLTQEDAAAIVSLAKLRGWTDINVHGSTEQKEKLWLAAMQRNIADQLAFQQGQENGTIPKTGEDGKTIKFQPMQVKNFEPLHDSAAYQQYLKEYAAAFPEEPELAVTEAKPEEKPETKPEETAEAAPTARVADKSPLLEKKSIPTENFNHAAKKDPDRKFRKKREFEKDPEREFKKKRGPDIDRPSKKAPPGPG